MSSVYLPTFYHPLPQAPRPPSPPDEAQIASPDDKNSSSTEGKTADGQTAGKTDAASFTDGLSPTVKAFLLQLQERGLSAVQISGTEADDQLHGGTNSVVNAGDGNDTVHVWSDSAVDGGAGDDRIDAWSGSVVDGGAGNDTIRAWSDTRVSGGTGDDKIDIWSDSYASGGDGNDTISAWSNTVVDGGAGDDVISAWSGSRVSGGDGNDTISTWSDSAIDGGAGNDKIYAISNSVVTGGTGDDTIHILGSDSLVHFAAGDGKDTLMISGTATIQLGEGLSPDNTTISYKENVATISFGDGLDQIELHMRAGKPIQLAFADGTVQELETDFVEEPNINIQRLEDRNV